MLVADDDDADLTNGTPHEPSIRNAFTTRHGITEDTGLRCFVMSAQSTSVQAWPTTQDAISTQLMYADCSTEYGDATPVTFRIVAGPSVAHFLGHAPGDAVTVTAQGSASVVLEGTKEAGTVVVEASAEHFGTHTIDIDFTPRYMHGVMRQDTTWAE